ncbi:amyloid fiber anchoring/assembly protein TapA [Mesobacillus maritimus]|uniref:amyloid fiber anchoring/assembly protein TapA n=1 Tax=Mesobacillus maritimus TaxID=1643336 RepID=UPI003850C45D
MNKRITNFVLKLIEKFDSSSGMDEEGRKLRRTRLKKFKKKSKGLVIAAQLISIWYLLIITGSYLSSNTGAYFNDIEVIENSLHVGEWDMDEWDKSSLDFDGSTVRVDGCNVYSTISNSGEDMTFSTWRYYLYKADEYLTGEPVATGTVPKLAAKETGEISAEVLEPGEYKFAVRRPLGHQGKNKKDEDGYSYIPSKKITVNSCNTPEEKAEFDELENIEKTQTTFKESEETEKTQTTSKESEDTEERQTTSKESEDTEERQTTSKESEDTEERQTTSKESEDTEKTQTTTKEPENTEERQTTTKEPEDTEERQTTSDNNKGSSSE